jgi:sugar phosphate permease
LSIFYVAIPVGAALGTILGGIVAAHFGWRNAFIWAGAPGLLLALTLLPFAEPKRGQADGISESSASSHLPVPRDVLKLLLIPDYLLVVLGYVAYTFAMGGFGYWGPTFLHRIHNIPQEKAATFFGAVLVVAGLVGTLIGGFAATAWHKRNRAGYAWLLGISVLLSIPVTAIAFLSGSEKISMTCLAIAMFLLFLSTGPVNTIIIEAVPMNLRTSAMALSIFMIHLFGDLWSPKIIGRFSDTWGSLQKAVMILPIALLVCAILWLCLAVKTMRSENQRQVLN